MVSIRYQEAKGILDSDSFLVILCFPEAHYYCSHVWIPIVKLLPDKSEKTAKKQPFCLNQVTRRIKKKLLEWWAVLGEDEYCG